MAALGHGMGSSLSMNARSIPLLALGAVLIVAGCGKTEAFRLVTDGGGGGADATTNADGAATNDGNTITDLGLFDDFGNAIDGGVDDQGVVDNDTGIVDTDANVDNDSGNTTDDAGNMTDDG